MAEKSGKENANVDAAGIGERILKIARRNNCTAQVTFVDKQRKELNVRNGKVEQLLSSVSLATGIRLFADKKSIVVSFSGSDFDDLEEKIATAMQDMTYLEEDDARRLLHSREFGRELVEIDLDDHRFESFDTDQVVETLENIEAEALALDGKIKPSERAEFSAARTRVHLFSSEGLKKSFARSLYTFSYSAVAEDKGLKEVDTWYESKRYFNELTDTGAIGRIAARNALKKLGGKKIASGERKVVFSARTASSILDLLADALDGEEVVTGNSFLVGRLAEQLFSRQATIHDNPLLPRRIGSYPCDGEGMNGRAKQVVERGKLLTFLHNSYTAAKLDMPLTGNASVSIRSSPAIQTGNFYLEPGTGSLEDLVKEMKEGLLVDELFLSGMNQVTGDFSFGCSGFLVENGAQTQPVKEVTIAGNLVDLFKNIAVIAADIEWKDAVSSPSFLVSKLTIAGL